MRCRLRAAALLAIAALAALPAAAQRDRMRFHVPPANPPRLYGTLLISRAAADGSETKPVVFAHWKHRTRYTCRVCHLELDFAFKTNATTITEKDNREGAFCGACHDGKTAFAVTGDANCPRCHTGTTDGSDEGYAKLLELPFAPFGNGVDWTRALARNEIHPVASIADEAPPITLDKTLVLEAEWNFVPPAVFPHGEHERWLDCGNCHPSIFNVKKKSTARFSMATALRGEFCGLCHLRVAFPLDDCIRCHPDMDHPPEL